MMRQEKLYFGMNRKALFFDIDGTLFSEIVRQVPQSAVLALKKSRDSGNLVFINTGRTWCQTEGIRGEVETDGMLCGCGTYLTAENKVLYDRRVSPERINWIREAVSRFRLDAVLEGVNHCYFRPGGPVLPRMKRIQSYLESGGTQFAGSWDAPDC